ncbi:hypothetical protein F5148DRAFT_515455 [Russula earlei]|uniref:Uncharacterized protein n=1 Tax=Russula earlei TaxID=71964 RepID=A0ACC0TXX3_9AGAM|nr:hypothetical protein F5148DRAFT_515455 [Russula earlei]
MTSVDARMTPLPVEETSPPSSGGRMVHSRQMSSLSATTFTPTSHSFQLSEPLLRGADHQETLSPPPLRHPASLWQRGHWERTRMRRVRRWRLFLCVLLSVLGSWASYTTVRYFIAFAVYQNTTRQAIALSLGICSLLSLLFLVALALSFVLPYYDTPRHRQSPFQGKLYHHASRFLASFFLFAPAVVNLVFVLVWRHVRSTLSLRGRCHWSLDVVWEGVGGQCVPHAPAFGVWLTAAIVRLTLTAAGLVICHIASSTYRTLRWPPSYHPEDIRRMDSVEISQITQDYVPSRPSPVVLSLAHKGRGSSSIARHSTSSSRMVAIPEYSDAQNRGPRKREHVGFDSAESPTPSEEDSSRRPAEPGTVAPKSLRHTTSSRDLHTGESSSRHEALPSNVAEGDLQGFADQFRSLVERVSRELEESRELESNQEPSTPPLHHVLDTHTPYMTIDEFGREVPSEEPIAVLGGIIRRMPTIESVGSRELASLRSTTLVGASGGGIPSAATTSSASSRPPTGATMASLNDAASASLASASQPSSRSNSIHRLRTPSELGELVRDAIRARGQPRPLPSTHATSASARPGSGGSLSGSGCGGESASGQSQRSRTNSLGPGEVLAPVTEHGELGREDARASAPRRRCESPDYLLAGGVGTSEMGELVRAERTRSWTSNSPSATSTYVTVRTSGSASGVGGVGGGDTGPRGHAGPR